MKLNIKNFYIKMENLPKKDQINNIIDLDFENIRKNKQIELEKVLKDLDRVVDGLGLEIDPKIKNTVVYLKLLGFNTSSSCGGHTEGEFPRFPYIHTEPINKPIYRYIKEKEILEEIINKYNLSVENKNNPYLTDIYRSDNYNAVKEFENIISNFKKNLPENETEEFKQYREKANNNTKKIDELLSEFIAKNKTNDDYLLENRQLEDGTSRTESRIAVTTRKTGKNIRTPEEIKKAQEEMNKFTDFLKDKYFNI